MPLYILFINFFVPTIENGEELWIRVCFSFFFVFHAKSATTNNHQIGLSDISYYSPFFICFSIELF